MENSITDFSSAETGQFEGQAVEVSEVKEEVVPAVGQVQYVYFKNSLDREPKTKVMPWSEFCERFSHHEARSKKDGMAWSPVKYQPNVTRGNAGVQAVYMAVLDIDDGTPVDSLVAKLNGLAALIHSSWSHTPEKPKYRVILPLAEPVPVGRWEDSWERICGLVDGHVDPATKDPARLFYAPSRPLGTQDYFVRVLDGKPLDIKDLPPAVVRHTEHTSLPKPDGDKTYIPINVLACSSGNRELDHVVARCKFMKDVSAPENQANVSEPLWHSMISNAVRFEGAEKWIHRASKYHPKYDEGETDKKLSRAVASSGPITCGRIQKLGYEGCPPGGCKMPGAGRATEAPAGLSIWADVRPEIGQKQDQEQTFELPDGYQIRKGMLGRIKLDKDGKPQFMPICPPLLVTALTRDENNSNWGRLLEFKDPDGNEHSWAMPQEMLSGNGESYRAVLLGMGLSIVPQASREIGEYIAACSPKDRALCVSQIGWHGSVFVLPDETYGPSSERVILQTTERAAHPYAQKGSLNEWKTNVSALCVGNSRLLLAVSTAFAAPLLKLLDEESGGIHFRGESSKGKTKILKVASSVWGGSNNMQRWKATGNGLEAVAANYNHTLLCLDELAQVSPKEAGEVAYMLANGSGKQRASRSGAARERASWRLLFLSAGEIGLAEHMNQDGQRVRAGQEVRMADVPVDAGAGMGAFEDLHGQPDGSRFANKLTEVAGAFYGTAGRAFVDWLTKVADIPAFVDKINRQIQQFLEANVPENADGQVFRVGRRFGLIAVAGELAVDSGVVAWQPGTPTQAAVRCLRDWIEARQGTGSQEEVAILAQVRRYLEQYGDSRFTPINDGFGPSPLDRSTINRSGFRKIINAADCQRTEFYVLPECYRTEICEGFDSRLVTKVLRANNLIEVGADGKSVMAKRLPGMGLVKVYCIKPDILGEVLEPAVQ